MDVHEAGAPGPSPGRMAALQEQRRQTRRKQVCVCVCMCKARCRAGIVCGVVCSSVGVTCSLCVGVGAGFPLLGGGRMRAYLNDKALVRV